MEWIVLAVLVEVFSLKAGCGAAPAIPAPWLCQKCRTLEMPLSFSFENRHLEMHLLSDLDINIYYLTRGPTDDSAFQCFTVP